MARVDQYSVEPISRVCESKHGHNFSQKSGSGFKVTLILKKMFRGLCFWYFQHFLPFYSRKFLTLEYFNVLRNRLPWIGTIAIGMYIRHDLRDFRSVGRFHDGDGSDYYHQNAATDRWTALAAVVIALIWGLWVGI
jgi:hypothetical protein